MAKVDFRNESFWDIFKWIVGGLLLSSIVLVGMIYEEDKNNIKAFKIKNAGEHESIRLTITECIVDKVDYTNFNRLETKVDILTQTQREGDEKIYQELLKIHRNLN